MNDQIRRREAAITSDRKYFRRHKRRRYRLRAFIPGEFSIDVARSLGTERVADLATAAEAAAADHELSNPPPGMATFVLVQKIDGGRMRRPFVFPSAIAEYRAKIGDEHLRVLAEQGHLPLEALTGSPPTGSE